MPINVGEKGKRVLYFIDSGANALLTINADCVENLYDCTFITPVLANGNGNDLENDKTPIYGLFQEWTTSVVFVLQKKVGGIFIDKATITDNTYGEYFPQGYWSDFPKYAGFIIEWDSVLNAFNEGIYRLKVTEVNLLNPSGKVSYSQNFCLKEYNCNTSNNTVRLEWYQNGKLGNISNDTEKFNFGNLNLYNQMRLPKAIFAYPKSEYQTEEIQYPNGEFQEVKDIQTETYILTLGLMPSYVHDILKTYALMSGSLTITDYSANNPAMIIRKAVKKKSGYEPRWSKQNKCAPVTLELQPRFNNLETSSTNCDC
jgi:hypothetical protein